MPIDRKARRERLGKANRLIRCIANNGRRFFRHEGQISRLELRHDRVWLIDKYTGRAVYTHTRYSRWRGFTEGGTLQSLVCGLRDYICKGKQLRHDIFGPWPDWYCGGDLWAYGESIEKVREVARELGIVKQVDNPTPLV